MSTLEEYCLKDVLATQKLHKILCPEGNRILFMIERDGKELALEWAKQTIKIYRIALLNKNHHARLPQYRRSFIESYISLKRFVEDGN